MPYRFKSYQRKSKIHHFSKAYRLKRKKQSLGIFAQKLTELATTDSYTCPPKKRPSNFLVVRQPHFATSENITPFKTSTDMYI